MRKVSLLLLSLFFTASLSFGQLVFINELHYDNTGTDVDEGVEIAGPAGTNLSCYKVYFYNGNGGTVYDSIKLSGTIDNEGAGFGAVWFAVAGIQNGSPDGLALYDSCNNAVVQFLSYEGTMTATNGVASGMLSVDIGVQENTGDPIGFSLQLQGTGVLYSNFIWNDSIAHTRDFINTGQVFQLPSSGGVPTYSIAQVHTEDANGVADSLNAYVRLYGVVMGVDLDGNAGYNFTIYDGTAGINVFSFVDVNSYVVNEGDLIYAVGDIDQFNGLTEIVPDTIVVVSTNNTLPTPTVVTALNESTESHLIRINGVSLVNASQWPSAGSSANVDITDGTNTYTMRIDSDTYIDDSVAAPTGPFDVIGIGGQFDNSSPYTSGYQILPQHPSHIIPVAVVNPTFSFSPGTITVNEGAGTVDITVAISTAADCAVEVALDLVGSTATQGSDFTFTSPQTLTFTASGPTTQTITIPIIDDATAEGDETIEFNLQNTSGTGGCNIGSPSVMMVTIEDNDYQYYPIIQVHDEDPVGVSLSDGDKAELRGIVTYPNSRPNGLQFYIQDATAGINVFSFNDQFGYSVTLGDSIIVRGTIDQFNGLTEIIPDTIILASQGSALPAYQVVDSLGEHLESELVELYGYTLIDPAQWTNSGSGFNVDVTNGDDTLQFRIDNDVALFGTTAPTGHLIIRGPVTQYDPTSPYFDGYQVLPAALSDIVEILPPVAAFTYTTTMPAITVTDASSGADSIVWDFDDGTIISDQSPYTHTYTANGTYNICLTAYNIAGSDTDCQAVTITGIGIDEPNKHVTELYPVPVKDQLIINTTMNVDFVEVISLTGQVVRTVEGNNQLISIATSDLAAGLYIVRIHAEEGTVIRKIVKE